jgi:hypothetical protein
MAALHRAHKRLLSAQKLLLGQKLPLAGIRYDVKGAIRDLQLLQTEIAAMVDMLEKHLLQGEQSS